MKELSKHFDHKTLEKKIYDLWERSGYFNPDTQPNIKKNAKPFTIIMPPPNANGSLHIGHAVFVTLEDLMIRYHRMKGEPTLWLPGADHAGFETQVVFEKKLERDRKSRFDFDRDTLYKMIWDFTQENKIHMENQLRSLGASCDWSREKFTLDKDIVSLVQKNFKKLYDDGLVYRDERPVNWCTKHQTSLSDLELKSEEQIDSLYYVKYGPITIATTRPETMFADVAVAVNPKDKKYKKLIGQSVLLPLTDRKIPVIADDAVDPKFGTGALKITPAHDAVDFEVGKRHKLEILLAIDRRGKLTELAGEFSGLKIDDARTKVVEKLKKLNLLAKIDSNYKHVVSRCYKCNRIIEPQILTQWFVKMEKLAKIGLAEVKSGRVKFVTKKFEKIFNYWLTNIRDWNISRQIVWGIRIPAWFCPNCPPIVTDGTKPDKCPSCGSKDLTQDTDVFDTWFSSGQWPFITLKTNKKEDFKKFYPTNVMETAWDILFFWVARMIMLGKYFTGKSPFKHVYLHGLVRDQDRQKISKSKGNVIDPLGVAEIYGTDAVRIALVFAQTAGNDTIISEEKIRGMRNFVTKIWNASRFVISQLVDFKEAKKYKYRKEDISALNKLNRIIKEINSDYTNFRFGKAAENLYKFFWHDFCDKILEQCKKRIYEPKSKEDKLAAQAVLLEILETSLKLLHPIMPFVTEEIYQNLPIDKKEKSIMITEWPLGN